MHQVLVLNQDFSPIHIAGMRRALVLIDRGKAEVLELDDVPIRTPATEIPRPSVIRLMSYIRRPRPRPKLSRHTIFARDGHRCLYCGKDARELTLDHVLPRHRGGRETWENLATACRRCNHRKGGRTPEEAHMTLRARPREPRVDGLAVFAPYRASRRSWAAYLAAS